MLGKKCWASSAAITEMDVQTKFKYSPLFFSKSPNITSIAEVPCYVLLLSGERDLVYPGVQLLFVFLSDWVPHFILQLLLGRHSYD